MTATVVAPNNALKAEINLPVSKSAFNRELIIRALANLPLKSVPNSSDDVRIMSSLLEKHLENNEFSGTYDASDAGTVFRFLTAFLANQKGNYVLTGSSRMKERPCGLLVDALKNLGANITYIEKPGFPPLNIIGTELKSGHIQLDSSISSQFITALMLIGPTLPSGLEITLTGETVSGSYIDLTTQTMKKYGVDVDVNNNHISIPKASYRETNVETENDWTSASYWYSIISLKGGDVLLPGLYENSSQGDSVLPQIFNEFGVESKFTQKGLRISRDPSALTYPNNFKYDFTNQPDLTQTMTALCTALKIPFELKGLSTLRIKETDRVKALQNELYKLGAEVMIEQDNLICSSYKPAIDEPVIETYGDHRMAMSFAPCSIVLGKLKIENPDVVSKSYPEFWQDIQSAGFKVDMTNF